MASTSSLPSPPSPQEVTAPLPSVNTKFRDLIAVLTELQASTGDSAFRFPSVAPLLLERRPDAFASVGVTKFRDYVALAVENGVVKAWWMNQDDGSLSLNNPGPAGPAAPTQSSKPSDVITTPPPPSTILKGGGVNPKFVDLVETLGELWKKGDKRPLLSHVGSELMKIPGSRARTLNACGSINFKAYAKLAKDAGIVEIYEVPGKLATMSLNPTIRVKAGYT